MTTLEIAGWKKGLNTVSLIKVVQCCSTGSLAKAKAVVDSILAGEQVVLEFVDEATREQFRKEAAELGVICR